VVTSPLLSCLQALWELTGEEFEGVASTPVAADIEAGKYWSLPVILFMSTGCCALEMGQKYTPKLLICTPLS
jgi:hypothetical protein